MRAGVVSLQPARDDMEPLRTRDWAKRIQIPAIFPLRPNLAR
jgi:hypothetical protein